jgi:ribose-phosphate pyrophosphokinase
VKKLLIAAMPGESAPAGRLAGKLGAACAEIAVHHFPDGESRIRAPEAGNSVIVYQSLDRPNEKLVELILAASALRDLGAKRLVLVAPYLCYMRQDKAFHPGEAVSQRVVGKLLAREFDKVVTVEPHLHRTRSMGEVFPDTETAALSSAPLLAELICGDQNDEQPVIVGPDIEALQWSKAVAEKVGAPVVVLDKKRKGDRDVTVTLSGDADLKGRCAYLIDDVASTGETIAAAARLLLEMGAAKVEAVVAHALFNDDNLAVMTDAGVSRIRSTDTVSHSSNAIGIAPLLAGALKGEG